MALPLFWQEYQASGASNFSATIAATSSVTVSMSALADFAATIDVTSGLTAALTTGDVSDFAATIAAASSMSVALDTLVDIQATIAVQSGLSAAIGADVETGPIAITAVSGMTVSGQSFWFEAPADNRIAIIDTEAANRTTRLESQRTAYLGGSSRTA